MAHKLLTNRCHNCKSYNLKELTQIFDKENRLTRIECGDCHTFQAFESKKVQEHQLTRNLPISTNVSASTVMKWLAENSVDIDLKPGQEITLILKVKN